MAKITTLSLALLAAFATASVAQEAEQPAEGTTTTEELPMGQPVGGQEVGKPYVEAAFEAFEQRCMKTELSVDPCELYMLLKDAEGASVAEFSMYNLPAGNEGPAVAGASFMAPLETLLAAGVTMSIDGSEPKAYPFAVCSAQGCLARMGFAAEEIEAMKSGAEVIFELVPFVAPDQKVTLKMSLKGFTAGYDAVSAANTAVDAAAAAKAAEEAGSGETTTAP